MKRQIKIGLASLVLAGASTLAGAATATATINLTATVASTGGLSVESPTINFPPYTGTVESAQTKLTVTTNNPGATVSASPTTGNLTASGSATPIPYALTQSLSAAGCSDSGNRGSAWTPPPGVAVGSGTTSLYPCFTLAAVTDPDTGSYTAGPITFTLTY